MPGNSFGRSFRVTTWGESHGPALGVVVDGCPAGLALDEAAIQIELDRRRPGQSSITTPRSEPDRIRIQSGTFEGRTTGAPISMWVANQEARSGDYDHLKEVFRPGHADFTWEKRYGIRDPRGGGRASARATVAQVAAGAVARQLLAVLHGIECLAWVGQISEIEAAVDPDSVTREMVERTPVRCPDPEAAGAMLRQIEAARDAGDSVGGVVEAVCRSVPAGLGDPVFEKLESSLASAMLTIPATRGFEIGIGFAGARLTGSRMNDEFGIENSAVRTLTNHSGGIQGGISNGMPILFRVAFKPTSTIGKPQRTVDREGREVTLEARGRHDPCVLPRAVPIVEAMACLVLADHALRLRGTAPLTK